VSAEQPARKLKAARPDVKDATKLARAVAQDSDLNAWIINEEDLAQPTHEASSVELDKLGALLSKTSLKAAVLMDLGHSYHLQTGDKQGAFLLYCAGISKFHEEINDLRADDDAKSLLLHAVVRNREDLKPIFWEIIEPHHDQQAVQGLYTLYLDYVNNCPPNDPKLMSVAQSEGIGLSELLYLKGQVDESLSLIKKLDAEPLSRDRRVSLEWIWGMALIQKKDYAGAIPHLKAVSESQSFKYADQALTLYVFSLCSVGQRQEAEKVVADFRASPKFASADPAMIAALDQTLRGETSGQH
jgi:hypothetical protein